ncbi:MAG: hypothetical protein JETCAE02_18860 [Anaerolineaceae bacterium]|nr:hypothetical protein [Anaerolineae bacterium]MBL1173226.1 hypothetical protein [Chloroflexota bacterium]MDL1925607.1 hypothetical protein [Anaerolineae bacterium AMX1]WKZ52222.1 MAG: hypothetical protein QY329_05705 [Anaerolineales bacterium]GJQ39474.1 MAG: hypothetical protein JETCAE02_18860 [Anaerolineaceae bacterium]
MRKRDWLISITFGLALGMLFFSSGAYSTVLAQKQTVVTGPLNQVILTALNSHTQWRALQGEAEVTWYGPNNETQTYSMGFEISQPGKGRIDTKSKEGNGNDGIWISDGENIYDLNTADKTFTRGVLPAFAKDFSRLPLSIADMNRDMPVPHPFAMFISSPLRDLIYPTEFIQSAELSSLTLVGEETILGRKTWFVIREDSSTDYSKIWIDKSTGILLRYVQYMDDKIWMDLSFKSLDFNPAINPATFELPSGYRPMSTP